MWIQENSNCIDAFVFGLVLWLTFWIEWIELEIFEVFEANWLQWVLEIKLRIVAMMTTMHLNSSWESELEEELTNKYIINDLCIVKWMIVEAFLGHLISFHFFKKMT